MSSVENVENILGHVEQTMRRGFAFLFLLDLLRTWQLCLKALFPFDRLLRLMQRLHPRQGRAASRAFQLVPGRAAQRQNRFRPTIAAGCGFLCVRHKRHMGMRATQGKALRLCR